MWTGEHACFHCYGVLVYYPPACSRRAERNRMGPEVRGKRQPDESPPACLILCSSPNGSTQLRQAPAASAHSLRSVVGGSFQCGALPVRRTCPRPAQGA